MSATYVPAALRRRVEARADAKGTDIGSVVSGSFVGFFNPRRDRWSDHFRLDDQLRFQPLTERASATANILAFNDDKRLLERQMLREQGRYPTPPARRRMRI